MLSLEEMSEKIEEISKTANETMKTMNEWKNKDHPLHSAQNNHNDPDDKTAKRANETDEDYKARIAAQEEEEKKEAKANEDEKEARKARYNAMKLAMDEDDEEKRDAAIKSAMEQKDPTLNTTPNTKESKKGQTEEEKEEHANVASIINDKRTEFITKILSANKIFNASNIDSVEKRLRKASLTKLKQEYKVILPFIGAVKTEEQPAQAPVIPFFASMMTPENVDASQLNASSPDSEFAKLSTKELLEIGN